MGKGRVIASSLGALWLTGCVESCDRLQSRPPSHATFCIGNGMFSSGVWGDEQAPGLGEKELILPNHAREMQSDVLAKLDVRKLIPSRVTLKTDCFMYNHNEELLTQLEQVLLQKANDGDLANAWRNFLASGGSGAPAAELEALSAKLLVEGEKKDHDLGRHLHDYRKYLAKGPVITLAHSQGNFYANMTYTTLYGSVAKARAGDVGRLRIVAVASPSSFVAGDRGEHLTFHEDLVILAVSSKVDPLLAARDKALGRKASRTLSSNATRGLSTFCVLPLVESTPHVSCENRLIVDTATSYLGTGVLPDLVSTSACAAMGDTKIRSTKCSDGFTWTSHDLVGDYLGAASSRERIRQMIRRAAEGVP